MNLVQFIGSEIFVNRTSYSLVGHQLRMCSTNVQVEIALYVGEVQTSNSGFTGIVAMQTPMQPFHDPQPHMSNRAHRKWILDHMEEMNVDDDHDHDSDLSF